MSQSTSITRRPASTSKISSVGIEAQRLEGLVIIGLEPAADHLFAHVVEPVFAQGPRPQPLDGLGRVVDLEVEDLDHVDEAVEPLGLGVIPGQPVQDQGVLLGDDQLLHLEDVQVPLEDPHRQVVGNHQPLRGVLLDLAAELAGSGDLAEDVAHRDVDQVGKLAEHGPLRPLAAARHSEQDDRAIPMTFFHDLESSNAMATVRERSTDAGELLESGAKACTASVDRSSAGLANLLPVNWPPLDP